VDIRFHTWAGFQLAGTKVEVEIEVDVLVPTPVAVFSAGVVGDALGVKTLSGQDVVPSLKGKKGSVPSIRVIQDDTVDFNIKIDIFPPPNLG
jgi:hypothetical protein